MWDPIVFPNNHWWGQEGKQEAWLEDCCNTGLKEHISHRACELPGILSLLKRKLNSRRPARGHTASKWLALDSLPTFQRPRLFPPYQEPQVQPTPWPSTCSQLSCRVGEHSYYLSSLWSPGNLGSKKLSHFPKWWSRGQTPVHLILQLVPGEVEKRGRLTGHKEVIRGPSSRKPGKKQASPIPSPTPSLLGPP